MPDTPSTDIVPAVQDGDRVRVILDCNWSDLRHALDMVIEAKSTFDRHENRIGWGRHFGRRDKTSFFVRRTKRGFSATDTSNA